MRRRVRHLEEQTELQQQRIDELVRAARTAKKPAPETVHVTPPPAAAPAIAADRPAATAERPTASITPPAVAPSVVGAPPGGEVRPLVPPPMTPLSEFS